MSPGHGVVQPLCKSPCLRLSIVLGLLLFYGADALAQDKSENTSALIEVLESGTDSKTRIEVLDKLAKNGSPEAIASLVKGVTSFDDDMAARCLSTLERHHRGSALEAALQCISAPSERCSKAMKVKAAKSAKSTWKKSLRGKAAFPKQNLKIQLELEINESIDKSDRWARHFHAELFEALMADPNIGMGDEVDLFSDGESTDAWEPQLGITLTLRGYVKSIKRKAKRGGNFQYTVTVEKTAASCRGAKVKEKRFKKASGVAISEDENSLETRVIKLALTKAARNLAKQFQTWTRGKALAEDAEY